MKMFWAILGFVLLFHVNGASCCASNERVSLLKFKASVLDPSNFLTSWLGFNCCDWNRIQCNPLTHHVIHLDLHSSQDAYYDGMSLRNKTGDVLSPLFNLEHLQHLDLSSNNFSDVPIPPGLSKLKRLRYLDLSGTGFSGDIRKELRNMSSLRHLDLSDCYDLQIMEGMQTWTANMRPLSRSLSEIMSVTKVFQLQASTWYRKSSTCYHNQVKFEFNLVQEELNMLS